MATDGRSVGSGLTSDGIGGGLTLDEVGMGRRVIGTGLALDWCAGFSSDFHRIGVRLESDWDRCLVGIGLEWIGTRLALD